MGQKIEVNKEETQKSLKEIHGNMDQKAEANKEELQNHLKKYRRTWVNK